MPARLTRRSSAKARAPEVIRLLEQEHSGATISLRFSNPLELLVATILSAQCTDERVNQVTETLFRKYRTPEDYLAVPEATLAADIRPTGFFNQKAKSIRGASAVILEEFGGRIPETMAELIRLPGVARKTANIVQSNSYPGRAATDPDAGMAVDTHVRRLSNRLAFSAEHDPGKIERDLLGLIPREKWSSFAHVLIQHGRKVCQARRPRCEDCVVSHLCPSSLV